MTVYHWITIILLADVLLILFVRGADQRRGAHRPPTRKEARRIEMETGYANEH